MRKLMVFWQPECPKCPKAKELAHELEAEGVSVVYFNTKDATGLAEATIYDVMSTPTLIVTEGDTEVYSWHGETPTKVEVLEKLG